MGDMGHVHSGDVGCANVNTALPDYDKGHLFFLLKLFIKFLRIIINIKPYLQNKLRINKIISKYI